MLIPCPWCGERDESEFSFGGEAHLERPQESCSDKEWTEYIFMQKISKGSKRNAGFISMVADNGSMLFVIQQQTLFFKQVSRGGTTLI